LHLAYNSRQSESTVYRSLQAGRAFAAAMVVLFHLGLNLAKDKYLGLKILELPFSFGNAGVEFFFVLSGFIIMNAHRADIGRLDRLAPYIRRRVLRIYPIYWIIFLVVFSAALLTPSLYHSVPHNATTIIQSLLLFPLDKVLVGGTGAPVIIVAWTLQYQIFFYFIFAILIADLRCGIVSILAIFVLYMTGLINGTSNLPFPLSFLAQDYFLLFCMGMLIALMINKLKPIHFFYFQYFVLLGLTSRPCKTPATRMNTSFFVQIACTKSLKKR